MKRLIFSDILIVVCALFTGYTFADVAHPENPDIVGGAFGNTVCFNNDGGVASATECDDPKVDEGKVGLGVWQWGGIHPSGINLCGTDAISPVSSATCPYVGAVTSIPCISDQFVLVQTIVSNHFWAVKADDICGFIATPESTALMPCRTTDAFDPVIGCATVNPPVITIEDGYIRMGSGRAPPDSDCVDSDHIGRMLVDGVSDIIYVCTPGGWSIRE